jgi:hypothetical protein
LNHYSGSGDHKNYLDTLGVRISPREGEPTLCYLCDHEPTEDTREREEQILDGADLALIDAHFPNIANHAYGHGSQEFASNLARAFPDIMFLATHHGPSFSDEELRTSFQRHSSGIPNLRLAVEGTTLRWDTEKKVFSEPNLAAVR